MDGGFADLHHPEHWDLSWSREDAGHYLETLDQVRNSMDFIQRLGGLPEHLRTGELFTSHEALHLPYETALTRFVPEVGRHYNLGPTSFGWASALASSMAPTWSTSGGSPIPSA